MPNTIWSRLNHLQLGRYAEYYAKMEFASYGFDVYTSEVDDKGIDFIARVNEEYYEVQVKAVRQSTLVIRESQLDISDHFLICYLRFEDGCMPEAYVFPSSVWNSPNSLFNYRAYDKPSLKSSPEYSVNYSKKNFKLLAPYEISSFFSRFI